MSEKTSSRFVTGKIPFIKVEWSYLIGLLVLLAVLLFRAYLNQPLLALDYSYSFLTNVNTNFFSLLLKPFLFLQEYLVFISSLLGIISLFFFQKIVEQTKILKKKYLFYSNLLFVINPLFLSTFTTLNEFIIIIPTSLFLLFQTLRLNSLPKKSKFYTYEPLLSSVLILFLALISLESAIFVTLLMIYLTKDNFKRVSYSILAILSLIIGFVFSTFRFEIISSTRYFAELGSVQVPSVFIIILGLYSLFKVKNLFLKVSTLLLFASYYFLAESRWALAILTVYFSAQTILDLNNRKWALQYLKKATLLLIYCSLLFVILSSIVLLVNAQPTSELSLMRTFEMQNSRTIAPKEIQYSANYFTGSKIIVSENPDVQELYSTIRMSKARELLTKLQTNFIIITKNQKETEWTREDEGLLLLLKNTDDFIKITDGETLELWEYRPLANIFN